MTTVAILGAGAWGTALAIHLAERAAAKPAVTLWTRDAGQARAIAAARVNERYLPGATLPASVAVSSDLRDAARADILFAATPVAALPELARELCERRAGRRSSGCRRDSSSRPRCRAVWASSHQVLAPAWPAAVGLVSGPTFAEEVARGLPTALTVAATDAVLSTSLRRCCAAIRCARTKATTWPAWKSAAR